MMWQSMLTTVMMMSPFEELILFIWKAMNNMTCLLIVMSVIMSALYIKMTTKQARSYSDGYGHKYKSHVTSRSRKRGHSVAPPAWITTMLHFIDCIAITAQAIRRWWTNDKPFVKKFSSKSARYKKRLTKLKYKKGKHYQRYWGRTKMENAHKKAARNRQQDNYYHNIIRQYYEEHIQEQYDNLNDHDDLSIDYEDIPGLIPQPMQNKCACLQCDLYSKTVFRPTSTTRYAKAPPSMTRPTATIPKSFIKTHLLMLIIGIIFGIFVMPASAMDLGDGNKALISKLPPFNGRKDEFVMWLAKFTALATMGAFAATITQNTDKTFGEKDCPKNQNENDALDPSVAADKVKIEKWKRNCKAFAAITLMMPKQLFRIIVEANGLASKAMELLYHEYKPTDTISRVEAERKYNAIKLNDNGNPRYYLTKFAEIANQHPGAEADDAKKMAIILATAPAMYQSILATTQMKEGENCTSDHLINGMEILYRQRGSTNQTHNRQDNGNGRELAMAAPGNRTMKCFNCGKPGHRAAQCRAPNSNNRYRPNNQNNNNHYNNNNNNNHHHNSQRTGNNANGTRGRRDIVCNECGMRGHTRDRCFCLAANASRRPAGWRPPPGYTGTSHEQGQATIDTSTNDNNGYELMLSSFTFAQHHDLLRDPNIWIGDTGASTHSTAHQNGLVNMKTGTSQDGIIMGNNHVNTVTTIGDIPGTFHDKHGNPYLSATINNVKYSPDNAFNLFSIPQLLRQHWEISGSEYLTLTSPDGIVINFDIIVPTREGCVYAACFKRNNEIMAVSADGAKIKIPPPKMTLNEAHAKFGHCSEVLTRKIATALGTNIKAGPFKPCVACGMGKAKQRNVPKSTESESPKIGERLHADISIIRKKVDNKSYVQPNWFMMVDAASGLKFSSFWNTKTAFIEPTCEILHRWITRGMNIKTIRCDNAGENKLWEARCKSNEWKLPIKFQYTAARTPQQNSQVEVGFAVIANRGRSLMAAANIPKIIRRLIWNEAFQTATLLDGLVTVTINNVTKTRWEHWLGKLPSFVPHLRTWGEAGVVKIRNLATPKVADRGVPCMMVGYSKNHPGDTYRMYDPSTGGIHDSRDVIWLRRMYYQTSLSPKEFQVQTDGILRDEPTTLPVHDFLDVDQMEEFDAQPVTITTTLELEEDDDNVDNDNIVTDTDVPDDTDNDDIPSNEPINDAEPSNEPTVRTTRSGRNVRPKVRFDEIDWNEYDTIARQQLSTKELVRQVRQDLDDYDDNDSFQSAEQQNNEEANDNEETETHDTVPDPDADDNHDNELAASTILFDIINFDAGELALVGASLGGGFVNTAELKPLNYEQAMAGNDKEKWLPAMEEEKQRFDSHKAVEAVPREKVPPGTRIMTSTWACKKKSNGTYRARLNLRGFLQIEGEHYDSHSIASPVVNIITIHIVLALIAILSWSAVLVDVRGAFLLGDWESDRQVYMEVPKGWSHHYPPNTVLRLLKTVYGSKQAAKRFWIKTLKAIDEMQFARSQADPCLYYKWHAEFGLILILSWVDDFLMVGSKAGVEHAKSELFKHFDCDDTGDMKEYVGNKIERKDGMLKITQPVLMQSFEDEFTFDRDHKIKNPAVPNTVLQPTEGKLTPEDQFTFRSGTGKLLHLMKWSRPEIGNAVRELSRWMTGAGLSHMKAMYRVINYCLNTSERGKVFKPHRTCKHEDITEFEFVVEGYSDSDYAKDPIKRRSVSGYCSFLEGCPVNTKSRMQQITSLSVTEAELIAATECAQDLVFIKNVLESIGLKVRLPMHLYIDNSGCIDLICNWSAGGRTRHIDTRMYYLRELKEEEPSIVLPIYCPSELNRSDIYTKNCDTATFDEHVRFFCTDEQFN